MNLGTILYNIAVSFGLTWKLKVYFVFLIYYILDCLEISLLHVLYYINNILNIILRH